MCATIIFVPCVSRAVRAYVGTVHAILASYNRSALSIWLTTTFSVRNSPSHTLVMVLPYGNQAQGDNIMPSKWAMSVSFAGAISSACSMFYILETILLIGIPLLSRKIMNNCGLSPVILSGVKSVRVLDKFPIISTQKM